MYIRKTRDEYRLYVEYIDSEEGAEEVTSEDSYSEIKKRRREYIENQGNLIKDIYIKKVRVPFVEKKGAVE